MAYIAMTLTNIAIATHGKKGTKPVEITEFMPNFLQEDSGKAVQSIEEMKAAMLNIAAAFKSKPGNQANPKRKPKKLAQNG